MSHTRPDSRLLVLAVFCCEAVEECDGCSEPLVHFLHLIELLSVSQRQQSRGRSQMWDCTAVKPEPLGLLLYFGMFEEHGQDKDTLAAQCE